MKNELKPETPIGVFKDTVYSTFDGIDGGGFANLFSDPDDIPTEQQDRVAIYRLDRVVSLSSKVVWEEKPLPEPTNKPVKKKK